MQALFVICLVLLAYTYVGYFLLLCVMAPLARRLRRPHRSDPTHTPRVTLLISLHNEEQLIAQRIDNFQALDYPADRLELLLGDDCSTDRTREIIRQRQRTDARIRLAAFDSHQGKTSVINQLAPQASGDIIAFSDANTFYAPDAMGHLARHFADPRVGSVSGRLILRSRTGVNTDDQYWQYETALKRREGQLGIVLGANGGIYALRKELFRPLTPTVIQIDDFIWPVRVYESGYFGVYEPAAVAHEESAPTVEAEFRRKVRIGTGDYRALVECRRLLAPWRGRIALAFWSHKVLRWLAPFLLLGMLISSACLAREALFRWLLAGQVAFYAAAGLGRFASRMPGRLAHVLRAPYYFVGSNAALLVGFWKCITGRQRAAWSHAGHRTT